MVGSLRIADAALLDLVSLFHKPDKEVCFDIDSGSRESVEGDKVRSLFDRFLLSLSSEKICITDCFRLIHLMMEKDDAIDVLKLYLVVRKRGGFDEVSRNELWDSVAEESGMQSCPGSTVKFIYTKYLDVLDKWLQKIGKEIKSIVGAKDIPSSLMDVKLECADINALNSKWKDGAEHSEASGLISGNIPNIKDGSDVLTDECAENVVSVVAGTSEDISKKRKRDLDNEHKTLQWLIQVAKDPCDPEIGTLPDCSKWKSASNEQTWKRILLAREAMQIKRNLHMGEGELTTTCLKQKMHPFLYEDFGQNESVRCSPRILSAKIASLERKWSRLSEPGLNSDSRDSHILDKESNSGCGGGGVGGRRSPEIDLFRDIKKRKRVSVGKFFQAEIPEWKGGRETYENDPKWVSMQVWPLKNNDQNKYLIERERMGKGRQDSCGCQLPGSVECVRFHVNEKKTRLKLELCSAYNQWQFDKMGENIALSWNQEDEKKFVSVVKANTPSIEKSFWIEIFKTFPKKSREELVSYYFNVFILQRRSQQNRSASSEIDSDDDESEGPYNCFGKRTASPVGSIFSSPKKPNSKNNSR